MVSLAFLLFPFLSFFAKRRKRILQAGKQKILIIPILTRIGDLVCATPVFRAIKAKYPESYLAVVVTNKIAPLIKNHPRVDEIIIYNTKGIYNTIKTIRRGKFLWSFNLGGTSIGTALSIFGSIPNRVKILKEERPLSEFLTDWMNNFTFLYKNHTYLPRYYLKILEFIGIKDPIEIKEVFTTPEGDKKAEELLRKNNLPEGDFLVGISITAGNKIKEWGDGKFVQLAKEIVRKYGAKIIFIGNKNDESRIANILRQTGYVGAVDFTLSELPSIIKKLKLYIAVDTGPIYIAHALKVPLIDIVGPVDPREQPPEDKLSVLVGPSSDIHPSSFVFKRPGKVRDHKMALESITVEKVLSAVEGFVKHVNITNS